MMEVKYSILVLWTLLMLKLGPLVTKSNGKWFLIGIGLDGITEVCSLAYKDKAETVDLIFHKVAKASAWIKQTTKYELCTEITK